MRALGVTHQRVGEEETPLPSKRCPHFFHWPQRPHQYDVILAYSLLADLFYLVGSTSACLRLPADADPHQSPISIKTFVLYAKRLKHDPCPLRLCEPREPSVQCHIQLDVLRILWFLVDPNMSPIHRVVKSGLNPSHTLT